MKKIYLSVVLAAMTMACYFTPSAAAQEEGGAYVPVSAAVALVTPDTENDYWNSFVSAAMNEAGELNSAGSAIQILSFSQEGDSRLSMIENIEEAIDAGVSYLVFASPNAETYTNALQDAADSGIQIIYAETKASADGLLFGPDNYAGAILVGEYLMEKLNEAGVGKGLIGIIDMMEDNDLYKDRLEGFQEAFKDSSYTLEDPVSCHGDKEEAISIANALMDRGAVAVFADGAAASEGLAESDEVENVLKIGWDWFEQCSDYVEEEMLSALVSADPSLMGVYVIDAVVAIENHEDLENFWIDTGIRLFEAGAQVSYE